MSLPFKFLDGTVFGPRFVLSIVVKMLISGFWEETEVKVKIMSPYWRPSRRNLKKDFDGINLRGVPITMAGKTLWARDWFHSFWRWQRF